MTSDPFVRLPTWARWILFIPAAAAASTVVMLIYQGLYLFDRFVPIMGDWFEEMLLTPTAFLVATMFFIFVGTAMAPSRRKAVAVFLALVPLALVAANVLIRVRGFQDDSWPMWRMSLDFLAIVAGAGYAVYSILKTRLAS